MIVSDRQLKSQHQIGRTPRPVQKASTESKMWHQNQSCILHFFTYHWLGARSLKINALAADSSFYSAMQTAKMKRNTCNVA